MIQSVLQQLQVRYGEDLDEAIISRVLAVDNQFFRLMLYQLGYVDERLQRSLSAGGKRFRPLLCLLAADSTGGSWRDALDVAVAIELLHNFSLVHDDIEDHDPVRRHRPTVWKLWGEPQAINVGDGMFAMAGEAVLGGSHDPQTLLEIGREFQATALGLTHGQYLDMTFEDRHDVTAAEYLAMVRLKTARLVEFSLWSGARVSGACSATLQALRSFGIELGIAFQIQDDIMGIWGASEATGKEVAKDLSNRKKTLPLLFAGRCVSEVQQRVLHSFYARDHDDVDAVLDVLERAGARTHAEEQVRLHLQAALGALEGADIGGAARDELTSLGVALTGQ